MEEEKNELMLSIWMIVYNHEKYLVQALESILSQKTSFEFQIVIGDDASSDNSRDILLKYKRKYPDKIKLILHDENVGMTANLISVLKECSGKYLASCEGDDYWIDPLKLQKQVDFLENHDDYSGVSGKFITVDAESCPIIPDPIQRVIFKGENYSLEDYLTTDLWPGQTATFLYRNFLLGNGIKYYEEFEVVYDGMIYMSLLVRGKIKIMQEVLSGYRFIPNSGDSWSARVKRDNHSLFRYMMYKNMEKIAYDYNGTKIDFSKKYLRYWRESIIKFIRVPNQKNFSIMKSIYLLSNNKTDMKLQAFLAVPKALVLKINKMLRG